jgi:CRISPR-associated protein Cas2
MVIVITYDVSTETPEGTKRLRNIAKICVDFGIRVQKSVFECNVDPTQWAILKDKLLSTYNSKEDSFRFYYLGSNWQRRVEHCGLNTAPEMGGTLIV